LYIDLFTVPTIIGKVLVQLNFASYLGSRVFLLDVSSLSTPKFTCRIFFNLHKCLDILLFLTS